ncbi:MAG: MutT/nudix family protein [Parcubacteria group bacterium GW2011_GWF2_44_8b]|nr:MAG: MutT/nudix family protein [Parcubacteria group bacterium GW2011_GWF2_44_8b]
MKMQLQSTLTNNLGQTLKVIYSEEDPLIGLDGKVLQGVQAFCFYGDKMVLVKHPKSGWMPPGGGIELGETYEQAIEREVREETNMEVIFQKLIGFQDIYEPERIIRQTRSFCVVKPYGNFLLDPGGEITEIKLINPREYKNFFDWGKIGDRIMGQALAYKNIFAKTPLRRRCLRLAPRPHLGGVHRNK